MPGELANLALFGCTGICLLGGGAIVAGIFNRLAELAGEGPRQMREIDVNGWTTTDEGWKQAQRQACPPGSICMPSRDNMITGMHMHADHRSNHPGELMAQYEQSASIHAIPDGIDHSREGSSLADSRIERTPEEAAILLGYGQEYRDSLAAGHSGSSTPQLPAGDDYIDTTWIESGDRKELHW